MHRPEFLENEPKLAIEAKQYSQIRMLLGYIRTAGLGTWPQLNRTLDRHYDETLTLVGEFRKLGYPIPGFDILSSGIFLGATNDVGLQAKVLERLEGSDYLSPEGSQILICITEQIRGVDDLSHFRRETPAYGEVLFSHVEAAREHLRQATQPLEGEKAAALLLAVEGIALGASTDDIFRKQYLDEIKREYVFNSAIDVEMFEKMERRDS